jgi:phenylalanyl-tRNA synthetase alpha chain
MQEIQSIRTQAENEITASATAAQLEELRIKYMGRNGLVNRLFEQMKTLSADQKKEAGQKINELKTSIEQLIQNKQYELAQVVIKEDIDTSLPGIRPKIGHLHPTTQVMRKLNAFFRYLGYSVYEGPEIETNEYNFEKLNLPKDHPARELADTLYIEEPEVLLRTHTSSVETRALTQEELPLRIVVPGKVYRNEEENATNGSMFYQYEGLVIDKNISMADLKGTLIAFVKFLYGPDTKTRFRAKYYPQVEPRAGLDIGCTFCGGTGCQVCKYRGYIEVLGAGMVHPNLLRACNVNPQEWSGFAFGMGFDRLVMLTYGITDVRRLYDGSLTFE